MTEFPEEEELRLDEISATARVLSRRNRRLREARQNRLDAESEHKVAENMQRTQREYFNALLANRTKSGTHSQLELDQLKGKAD